MAKLTHEEERVLAFLLGRLRGQSDEEVRKMYKKQEPDFVTAAKGLEEKKLAYWAPFSDGKKILFLSLNGLLYWQEKIQQEIDEMLEVKSDETKKN